MSRGPSIKRTIQLLLLIFLPFLASGQDGEDRYPIRQEGRWGYMNAEGELVIEPRFKEAGPFHEGRALVRKGGTYGYIDRYGDMLINARYSYAEPFKNGRGKVYRERRDDPFLIDREGEFVVDGPYESVVRSGAPGLVVVKTSSEKAGLVDVADKSFVLDTQKIYPYEFSGGLSVIYGADHDQHLDDPEADTLYQVGVMDTTGEVLVPFGKYKKIEPYRNGYTLAETPKSEGPYVLDDRGRVTCQVPEGWFIDQEKQIRFVNGAAIVSIYKDRQGKDLEKDQYGAMTPEGKLLFKGSKWYELLPFKHDRAFGAIDTDENDMLYYMLDKKGQAVNEEPFHRMLYSFMDDDQEAYTNYFTDGIAVVESKEGWIGVDRSAEKRFGPLDEDVPGHPSRRKGYVVILREDISTEPGPYTYRYGFWDMKNGTVLEPRYHELKLPDKPGEPIRINKDGSMGYIDREGDELWMEEAPSKDGEKGLLDITYKNRTYYFASAPYQEDLNGPGGHGDSDNGFEPIEDVEGFPKSALSLILRPDKERVFAKEHEGIRLDLANRTSDTLYFPAEDSRLELHLQARDPNGEWRDIEYVPSSWCGNSDHTLYLPSGKYWTFTVPRYKGEIETEVRAVLVYHEERSGPYEDKEVSEKRLTSNAVKMSVNPGQFWRKPDYQRRGIMDPYNE